MVIGEVLEDNNLKPITYGLMDKTSKNAGLEVADFIIHIAGGQARRTRHYPETGEFRKDFKAIFKTLEDKWASYFYILGAKDIY
ncbi:hypothetical protein LCGC14_1199580 [marine sediment metagenome]|uniref:Uncharacterized protein n=1 Tax=marine sediment metagenome TaxID=412755 RepID=A0A0F9NZT0_9ZZZZ|nr:MAG: hypothetical protein Lokiarch_10320 [Candidatus Lokiarchaeum sp. GC14_75]